METEQETQTNKRKKTSEKKLVSTILNPMKDGKRSKYLNPDILDLIRNPDAFAQKIALNVEQIEKSDLDIRERMIFVNTLLAVFKTFGEYYKEGPKNTEEVEYWKKETLKFVDMVTKDSNSKEQMKKYLISWIVPRLTEIEKKQFNDELAELERKLYREETLFFEDGQGKLRSIEIVKPEQIKEEQPTETDDIYL